MLDERTDQMGFAQKVNKRFGVAVSEPEAVSKRTLG